VPRSAPYLAKSALDHSETLWNGRDPRELYALDPESWAVLESHGDLRAGVGYLFHQVCAPRLWDPVYIGVDPRRAFSARVEFPGCHLSVGDGPSGGERAVMRSIDLPHYVGTCRGLTIGSGDHEFVELADEARRLGLRVRVVSWATRLSGALATVAHEVVLLDHFLPGGPRTISPRPRTWRGTGASASDFTEAA